MKRIANMVILAATPLLMAAIWMDRQPSHKPYQAPVLAPPEGAVPVTGREVVPPDAALKNPLSPSAATLAQGKSLFTINCAMCHGATSAERGPVGKKLVPPPPALDPAMVQGLSDAAIFKAVTLGFGRMPPFKDKLTPHERWLVATYLRTRP